MATSLNSIMDANPDLGKGRDTSFGSLVDELSKMGARHGKKDKALVQQAHDCMKELADGIHCVMGPNQTKAQREESVAKANARHSKVDMARISKMHDMCKELGADCPAPKKETGD